MPVGALAGPPRATTRSDAETMKIPQVLLPGAAVAAMLLGGCGGGDDAKTVTVAKTVAETSAPPAAANPAPSGETLPSATGESLPNGTVIAQGVYAMTYKSSSFTGQDITTDDQNPDESTW